MYLSREVFLSVQSCIAVLEHYFLKTPLLLLLNLVRTVELTGTELAHQTRAADARGIS